MFHCLCFKYTINLTLFLIIWSKLLASQTALSREQKKDFFDLSLEELLSTEITVVTGKPQNSIDAPGIVSVITSQEIDFWGYQSVAEAINKLPGIYCIDNSFNWNCGMRGINGGFRSYSRVFKVMVNGHPVSFRSDGNNYLGPEFIPIKVVKQIEVIRGPASAVYGANAYLGVVNIITKHPDGKNKGELNLTQNQLGNSVSVNFHTHNDIFHLTSSLYKGVFDRSGAQIPDGLPERSSFASGTETIGDKSSPLTWFGQLGVDLEHHSLDINTYYSRLDSKAHFVDFGRFTETGELSKDVRISLDNWFVQVKDEWRLRDGLMIKTSLAYSEGSPTQDEKLDVGLTATYSEREFGFQSIDFVGEVLWDINDSHHLTFGVDYTEDNEKLFEVFDVDRLSKARTQKEAVQGNKIFFHKSLFAQYEGRLNSVLGLTGNFRFDDQNIYGKNSSYRIGAVYKLSETVSTKLLYGTSFKAPTAVQLYGQPLFDGEVTGNADLQEESAKTWEAELNWLIKPDISWSINAYQMRASDLVVLMGSGFSEKPENLELQDTLGVETDIQWQGKTNSLLASVSVLESKTKSRDILDRSVLASSALYPKFTSNVFWKYAYSSSFNFGINSQYSSPRRASKSNILLNGGIPYQRPAYHLMNMAMNYRYDELSVHLGVRNLLDRVYSEPGFSGVDVPGAKRNIQVNFNYNF